MVFSIEFVAAHWRFCILIAPPGIPQTDATFAMCRYPQNPATLFIRVADNDLSLRAAMEDDCLSIGFDSENGYIRTRTEGGLFVFTKPERNFLKKLELAVAELLELEHHERTKLFLDLKDLMWHIVHWMRVNHRSPVQGSSDYEEDDIVDSLRAWHLEYDQFKAFLRATARLYYDVHGSDRLLVRLREDRSNEPEPCEQGPKSAAGVDRGNVRRTTSKEGGMELVEKISVLEGAYRLTLNPKVREFRTSV